MNTLPSFDEHRLLFCRELGRISAPRTGSRATLVLHSSATLDGPSPDTISKHCVVIRYLKVLMLWSIRNFLENAKIEKPGDSGGLLRIALEFPFKTSNVSCHDVSSNKKGMRCDCISFVTQM